MNSTGITTPSNHFALFANDGTDIALEAPEDTVILMLGGEPIDEPIVSNNPFLMNIKAEIL